MAVAKMAVLRPLGEILLARSMYWGDACITPVFIRACEWIVAEKTLPLSGHTIHCHPERRSCKRSRGPQRARFWRDGVGAQQLQVEGPLFHQIHRTASGNSPRALANEFPATVHLGTSRIAVERRPASGSARVKEIAEKLDVGRDLGWRSASALR